MDTYRSNADGLINDVQELIDDARRRAPVVPDRPKPPDEIGPKDKCIEG